MGLGARPVDEWQYERAAALETAEREAGVAAARAGHGETPHEADGVRWCLDCEAPIDPRRLEAMPTAVRCTDCQAFHTRSLR